ncbi:MAG: aminotransferase class I/II-fold pyridoxal phosphate-dependent enzyme [Acidobacteria bacterium]|nr:aminotransferase class I/II-fold pyridoxal phosphate-dependent enzyme [Acidobacteriota bacterium]MCW5968471.1 aminotransferase class I/II-fold pyridoxal phosphate-dependent enzyme [Blastocatellales bacterium]
MSTDKQPDGAQTVSVHTSRAHNATSAVSPPIWQTTTFSAETAEDFAERAIAMRPAEFYTRYGNPTHRAVEATLAALERAETAIITGSGMGAIFAAVAALVERGDHIVVQRNHYAGSTTLFQEVLPRWGIQATAVDQTDADAFAAAITPQTKLVYVETPTNPLMQITDLRAAAELARAHNLISICDNTFATPINQRPIELGLDLVVHSATKYLGGHHDVTAGAIIGSQALIDRIWKFAIVSGATLSPFDGWLLLRGLRTLGLRVERHNLNGAALARFLSGHPKVERVYYPGLPEHPQHELARSQMQGFTGMLSIEMRGGYSAAEALIRNLRLATRAASLGGFETLIVHPAAMWGLQLSPEQRLRTGVSDSLVRISAGIEDEADLLADFAAALEGQKER